jgi:hypothetical protein
LLQLPFLRCSETIFGLLGSWNPISIHLKSTAPALRPILLEKLEDYMIPLSLVAGMALQDAKLHLPGIPSCGDVGQKLYLTSGGFRLVRCVGNLQHALNVNAMNATAAAPFYSYNESAKICR